MTNLPCDLQIDRCPVSEEEFRYMEKRTHISENLLTLFSLVFGEPYSIYCEGKGLINNLAPQKLSNEDLTGLGSKSNLGYHIENTALQHATGLNCSPVALSFVGISQDPSPPYTKLSDVREALHLLSYDELALLQTPIFRFKLPYRWRNGSKYENYISPQAPILRFDRMGYLTVNLAFCGDMLLKIKNKAANNAVITLTRAIEKVELSEVISPGTFVCIDNRVVVHSRTAFNPSFDEEGRPYRWIQRLFVTNRLCNFDNQNWISRDYFVFEHNF